MKITAKAVIIAMIIAGVVSAGLGFLDGLIRARTGGEGVSATARLAISVSLAVVVTVIISALSGNKALALASAADSQRALGFASDPQRAVVYLFRDAFVGKLVGIDVLVDGKPIAQTRGKTFLRLELEPGQHVLTSSTPSQGTSVELSLNIAAGSVSYVEQSIKMGAAKSAPAMTLKDESESQARIRRCRLLSVAASS
jgi:hypothetical protein